jgi:hypothetical protein
MAMMPPTVIAAASAAWRVWNLITPIRANTVEFAAMARRTDIRNAEPSSSCVDDAACTQEQLALTIPPRAALARPAGR